MDCVARNSLTRQRPRKRKRAHSGQRADDGAAGSAAEAAPTPDPQHMAEPPAAPAPAAPAAETSFYQRTNPHKPSFLPQASASRARKYTLSIALPGSIILNAQTPELQARLAGQIARTCAIFNVDEIVVFDDREPSHRARDAGDESADEGKPSFDANGFLARVLQYLETPQYLRKALFPMHSHLRHAGLLPPIDAPHHLRFDDESEYREGVTVDPPPWAHSSRHDTVWVNIGWRQPIEAQVPGAAAPPGAGVRVTVRMPTRRNAPGALVSPREPVERAGLYWGYTVRLCSSLVDVLMDNPWANGRGEAPAAYDLVVGTSERGVPLTELLHREPAAGGASSNDRLRPFHHALVVLGGLSGLEVAVERDPQLTQGADDAHLLFDYWVNVVEHQGSRTVRTEEALMITLARMKTAVEALGR